MLTLVHDLRNPMNVAKMCAQIIKKYSTDSTQAQRMAEMIDKNMGILDSMLKELMDASGMAKAHHGIARIENSPEQGTDFIVELPKKT